MILVYVTYTVAALLAILPTALVWTSRGYVIKRRKEMLAQDFSASNDDSSEAFNHFLKSRRGVGGLQCQIQAYMTQGFWFPSLVLTLLNVAGFTVSIAYVRGLAGAEYGPVLYTFLGAYIFNLGVLTRRLSLCDFNAQMLWSSINRLVLATGLSVALRTAPFVGGHPESFFAIGFIASVFLEALLNGAQELAGIRTAKRSDAMSLQMVRGIDVWKSYRLEEEGIEDIQNLATADVLDLVVRTHYNLMTLLDWIDQAVVIARFRENTCKLENVGLSVSAIDLAWSSPRYRNGDDAIAKSIATRGDLDLAFVTSQLNALYEDQFVRNLWTLWQTRPGYHQLPEIGPAATPQTRRSNGALPTHLIRATTDADAAAIVQLSQLVYPEDAYRENVLRSQRARFPDGQFVAVAEDGTVLGMSSCMRMDSDRWALTDSWETVTGEGLLSNHNARGDTLYGVETMVHPRFRRHRVGYQLVQARLNLACTLGVQRIRTGVRLSGYGCVSAKLTPETYVDLVLAKRMVDPSLTFMLTFGFKLLSVVKDYVRNDSASAGCAALLDYEL